MLSEINIYEAYTMGKKDVGMYNNLVYISQIGIMMITPILGGVVVGNYLAGDFQSTMVLYLS